jgi:HAD superfamily hydrolase (TIGR01509 family)
MIAQPPMPGAVRALLWDVDGTLAESERDGHRVAFNRAFESMGLPWHWSVAHYGGLLRITGGRERILADMQRHSQAPALGAEREGLARELHLRKNIFYAELVQAGAIPLRDGVRELIDEATAVGLRQGITTTTSRSNADALLRRHFGGAWARRFAVVVCGEDVATKKPDPEVYRCALQALDLDPLQCVALEDSPGGAAAARAAGVPVVVTRSAYFANDAFECAIAIGPGLHTRAGWSPELQAVGPAGAHGRVTLDDLLDWHARIASISPCA